PAGHLPPAARAARRDQARTSDRLPQRVGRLQRDHPSHPAPAEAPDPIRTPEAAGGRCPLPPAQRHAGHPAIEEDRRITRWVPVCSTDDVEPEDLIGVQHDGHDYAVYRAPDDRFYATDGHCTHERELLCDGLVMDGIVECPKHNGRFDYTTGKAKGAP